MSEMYTYRYPNERSYALLPVSKQHGNFHWQGVSLRHGYIYGYKSTTVTSSPAGSVPAGTNATFRQIDFANSKIFQFNPSALSMKSEMMNVEDAATMAKGGNLTNAAVGLASSSLELFFDRTEEIARSNKGIGDEIWRDLGVQVDLFDFLRVISGGDESLLGTFQADPNPAEGWGSVQKGSMNQLSGMLFDAAVAGSRIMFRPFAIVFNPNLTMHVMQMSSFAYTYLRFTSDLVPTSLQLNFDVQITNMGTKSYATSVSAPTATSGSPGSGTSTPPPGTTDPSLARPAQGNF